MQTFFGAVTETNDLGVVAEQCPHCNTLKRCLLRTVHQGHYICFMKIADPVRESSCLCTDCLKPFPGKPYWSYAEVVPIREARDVDLDQLLTKTNPILADRIRFKEQIRELGGDERFAVAYDSVERMRPGRLRSKLLKSLEDWPQLSDQQRNEAATQIGELSHAWQFARHIAVGFPTSSGSLVFYLSVIAFGIIVIGMLITRNWVWGGLLLAICVATATILESFLFKQSVAHWARRVLVSEAQELNVPLDRFIAAVDDIPGCKLGLTEELWPMREQLANIRETLIAAGKLPSTSATEEAR
jgi:hypothetical protein